MYMFWIYIIWVNKISLCPMHYSSLSSERSTPFQFPTWFSLILRYIILIVQLQCLFTPTMKQKHLKNKNHLLSFSDTFFIDHTVANIIFSEYLLTIPLTTQSCPTLWPMDCSLPGSYVHGILQAKILEWVLQGIFPTQGSNSCLLHCRQMLYPLSHQGRPLVNYMHGWMNGLMGKRMPFYPENV